MIHLLKDCANLLSLEPNASSQNCISRYTIARLSRIVSVIFPILVVIVSFIIS